MSAFHAFEASARSRSRVRLSDATELLGRLLLSVLFFVSGVGKVTSYASVASYMAAAGVSSALLPVATVTELLGALAILLGWQTRWAAALLAGYSLLAALLFHASLGDQVQQVMFLKNVSIAGGFLLLAARGAGRYSLDHRLYR